MKLANVNIKTFRWLIVACLIPVLVPSAQAGSAYALASDGSAAWGKGDSQKEAERIALSKCREIAKKSDCKVKTHKAIALAEGGGRFGVASGPNQKLARENAIKNCNHGDCKITGVTTQPGFFAFAQSDKHYYLHYGAVDPGTAEVFAVGKCVEKGSAKCSVEFFGAIPEASVVAKNQSQASNVNCPPKQSYQCEHSCINTNCEVRFSNGCQMKVTVRQKQEMKFGHNPATGKQENYWQWVNEDPCKSAAGF